MNDGVSLDFVHLLLEVVFEESFFHFAVVVGDQLVGLLEVLVRYSGVCINGLNLRIIWSKAGSQWLQKILESEVFVVAMIFKQRGVPNGNQFLFVTIGYSYFVRGNL